MRKVYKDFRAVWLSTYIKQYKEGNREQRKLIRDNIYQNIQLTEDEKDNLWEDIVRWGLGDD